jgi:hypothetical protein
MRARKAYFSFSHLSDQTKHHAYNSWHQLDHRPENLALDSVLYGERWVHTPRCAASRRAAEPVLAPVQYVTAYWFAEPSEPSISEWQELAEISFQWGRRPDRPWTLRPLQGSARARRRSMLAPASAARSVSTSTSSMPIRTRAISLRLSVTRRPSRCCSRARWRRLRRGSGTGSNEAALALLGPQGGSGRLAEIRVAQHRQVVHLAGLAREHDLPGVKHRHVIGVPDGGFHCLLDQQDAQA